MKLTIVADQQGKIISISQFGDIGEKVSGITKAGVDAGAGHSVHEIDLPNDLERVGLLEIHKAYRFDPKGNRLVKA